MTPAARPGDRGPRRAGGGAGRGVAGPRRGSGRGAPRPGPRGPARPARRSDLGGDQVEGRRAVLELLRAKRREVRRVLIAEQQDDAEQLEAIEALAAARRVPVQYVARARLDREAGTEGHQGVVARCAPVDPVPLSELLAAGDATFLLVCDGVTDPRNLGALLRSAECAGVTGVVLPTHRAARLTPAVTKTAAGAVEHLDFSAVGGVPSALRELADQGVEVVGLAPEARRGLFSLDLGRGPVALVIGGEERGLGRLTKERCSVLASIPQRGTIESLNAAVAGAIACFEVSRQRAALGR